MVRSRVRGIDLFASCGGLTLGMKAAGVQTVYAVEIDPYRVATFAGHTRGVVIINADIRTVDLSTYRGRLNCSTEGRRVNPSLQADCDGPPPTSGT